uniref:trypsin n=1 Tax=Vespula pensylvanica TaxID=30213 RepID=A0A834NZC9_VESPE|nr:hypothetical protein H0235_009883 [Vespula pensylvanica]
MQGGRSNVQSENPPRIELVSPFTTDLWHPRPFPFTEVTPSQPNSGKDLHFLPFKLHQQRFYLKHPPLLDHRIVGGKSVDILDHPHQASLLFQYEHHCGASVISEKWVITAAHCMRFPQYFYLVSVGSNATKSGIRYGVSRVISHPMFDFATLDYDVSLIQVEGKIFLNNEVKPIKLTFSEPTYGFMNVTGWGKLKESGDDPYSLQGVNVPIISRENCQATYRDIANITEHMICAGMEKGGRDACQGDSGGPLSANGTLYGIVSWGHGCAQPNYPGVYTNIASLRFWILKMSGV